eukprot:2462501-Pleurochrysis_carterae.AAC.6
MCRDAFVSIGRSTCFNHSHWLVWVTSLANLASLTSLGPRRVGVSAVARRSPLLDLRQRGRAGLRGALDDCDLVDRTDAAPASQGQSHAKSREREQGA